MGATKNNTEGTGKNSDMRKHTKFLGGLKNRGGKTFRGPVTEGCNLGLEKSGNFILSGKW